MRSLANTFQARLVRAISRRRAASAIEYALLASLIAMVIISAVTTVGVNLGSNFYNRVAAALT